MSIVFDSCCLMDGLMGYDKFSERIIRLQSKGEIRFAISEELLIEYIFVPIKIADNKIKESQDKGIKINISNVLDKAYETSKGIAKTISKNSIIYKVTSKGKYVLNDSSDDKLVNLAIDSNSPYIVTKNSQDFWLNEVKKAKTKNGIVIDVLSPFQFYSLYKMKNLKYV